MSPQENRVAAELALWGALLLFVWMRLTDGTVILGQSLGTVIVEQSPGRLLFTYFAAGVIAAIGQLIIRAVVFRKEKDAPADERERFIEKRHQRKRPPASKAAGRRLWPIAQFGHGALDPLLHIGPNIGFEVQDARHCLD